MRPLLAVRPVAVNGGYGVQLQLVPRGTESPSATIDHVRGALAAPAAAAQHLDVTAATAPQSGRG